VIIAVAAIKITLARSAVAEWSRARLVMARLQFDLAQMTGPP
jgi:hypothetical protein